ncbi:hypothetical protein ACFL27_19250 [candidate division CSSED10-310 bacterium]|uniref:BACON domain-containing protein n=1 Tax=candidate division CSSED10-310 bacterium TaxID=2855610 RepID=A0ABV6Z1L1_UNCC1
MKYFRVCIIITCLSFFIFLGCPGEDSKDPASLALDQTTINFGASNTSMTVVLRNDGEETANWSVSYNCEWIQQISPNSGSLEGGATVSVTIVISRSGCATGDHNTVISFSAEETAIDLTAQMTVACAKVRFYNSLYWTSTGNFCATLTGKGSDGSHTWNSVTGNYSSYQNVCSTTLSSFTVKLRKNTSCSSTAQYTINFSGTFNLKSGKKYSILLYLTGSSVTIGLTEESSNTGVDELLWVIESDTEQTFDDVLMNY